MSIYIPGMEMPKNCLSCPFMISLNNDDCILQSEEANEYFENWEQMKAGCPLVEVPPHGRLIDADALRRYWLDAEKKNGPDMKLDLLTIHDIITEGCVFDLEKAPTIIPADPKEVG